jgi:hypothetical protein
MNPQSADITETRGAIQAALKNHEALSRERSDLLKLQQTLTVSVAERTRSSSLTDAKAVRDLGDDRTRLGMVPDKIAHLDTQLAESLECIEAALGPVRVLLAHRTGEITQAAEKEIRDFLEARVSNRHSFAAHCEQAIGPIVSTFDVVARAEADEGRISPMNIRLARDQSNLARLAREAIDILERTPVQA